MAKKMLTVEDVKAKVKNIKNLAQFDHEAAHSREDTLYLDVLKHIAKHGTHMNNFAQEALKAAKIKFPRHCS